jgi:hypothetical protein
MAPPDCAFALGVATNAAFSMSRERVADAPTARETRTRPFEISFATGDSVARKFYACPARPLPGIRGSLQPLVANAFGN